MLTNLREEVLNWLFSITESSSFSSDVCQCGKVSIIPRRQISRNYRIQTKYTCNLNIGAIRAHTLRFQCGQNQSCGFCKYETKWMPIIKRTVWTSRRKYEYPGKNDITNGEGKTKISCNQIMRPYALIEGYPLIIMKNTTI